MKYENFKGLSPDQLDDELRKLKKEQFNLRFQQANGQLENTARFRQIRRDIARVRTMARQVKVTEAAASAAGGAK